MSRAWMLWLSLGVAACAPEGARPVEPRLGEDACAQCRMVLVSDATAGQIAAPGAEPIMFDDLGCLRDYLREHPLAADAVVFAADHRTGSWLDARQAILTRAEVPTPMGSRVIAHADRESRDADPDALHGEPLSAGWLLGADRAAEKGRVP